MNLKDETMTETMQYDFDLAVLILQSAKRNSLLIRFATTKAGRIALFLPLLVKSLRRIKSRDPQILQRRSEKIDGLRQYSLLAHSV